MHSHRPSLLFLSSLVVLLIICTSLLSLTTREVDRSQNNTYQEGYRQGLHDGTSEGFAAGYARGMAERTEGMIHTSCIYRSFSTPLPGSPKYWSCRIPFP